MNRFITIAAVIAAATIVVGVLAVTGGSATKKAAPSGYGMAASTTAASRAGTVVQAHMSALGRVLTDGQGRTLYLFRADKPNVSELSTAGLGVWPPFAVAGKPQAKGGALAVMIGTITGADGNPQVTYDGHPLYYYIGDTKPGQTKGQALNQFGAEWYVVAPGGNEIDNR